MEALTLHTRCERAPKTRSSRQFHFNVMFLKLKINVKKIRDEQNIKSINRDGLVLLVRTCIIEQWDQGRLIYPRSRPCGLLAPGQI